MIDIDIRKIPSELGEVEKVKDGSVRILRYTQVVKPEELLTMKKGYSWNGDSYTVTVNLPEQRKLVRCITLAHTSANCWKITVSTPLLSDTVTVRTFAEALTYLSGL